MFSGSCQSIQLAGSTRVRGPTTGDSFSLLSLVLQTY